MAELETRWHDLGEFIREQRRIGHLSLRKLSEMAGISNPYLSQIERGLRKPIAWPTDLAAISPPSLRRQPSAAAISKARGQSSG